MLCLSLSVHAVGVLSITKPILKYTANANPIILDPTMILRYDTSIGPIGTYLHTGVEIDYASYALEAAGTWPGGTIFVTIDTLSNDNFRDSLTCSPVGANITTYYIISLKQLVITASTAATIGEIQSTLRTLKFSTTGMIPGPRKIRIWVIPKNYFFINSRNGRVYIMAGTYRAYPSGIVGLGSVAWTIPATNVANEPLTWGLKPYSASIASQDEQDFLNTYVNNLSGYASWLGGTYSAVDDGWIWVGGPDAGIKFFLKDTVLRPGSGANGLIYHNFRLGEPNGDYVGGGLQSIREVPGVHTANNGWNDLQTGISSWIWEMGGMPSDANIITVHVFVNNPINQGFPF